MMIVLYSLCRTLGRRHSPIPSTMGHIALRYEVYTSMPCATYIETDTLLLRHWSLPLSPVDDTKSSSSCQKC